MSNKYLVKIDDIQKIVALKIERDVLEQKVLMLEKEIKFLKEQNLELLRIL